VDNEMDIKDFRITIRCLFCNSGIIVEEGKKYESGDMLKCIECGELNDFHSLINVAKEEGMKQLKEKVERQLHNEFKDIFKKKS